MNTADIAILAVLLVGGLLGFVRGAIRQMVNALAWVASLVVPYFFSAQVGHFISDQFDAPYPIAYVVAGIGLAILSQLITRLIIAIIGRILRKVYDKVTTVGETDEEKAKDAAQPIRGSMPDRLLGGMIGAGKWAVVIWVLLSGFALIARPLREKGIRMSVEDAESYKLAEQHNAFRIIWSQDINRLSEAVHRMTTRPKVRAGTAQKAYEALAQDDRMKQVMADEPLKRALASGDFQTVVASPHVLSLLTDPEAMEHVIKLAMERETGATAGIEGH